MRQFIKPALAAAAIAFASPVLAQDIIVVSHGQANEPARPGPGGGHVVRG